MDKIDNVHPGSKWVFDDEVAGCFANMLERSIPDYRSMRSLIEEIGNDYIRAGTAVIDIGCSTGLAVEPFIRRYGDSCRFLLIDNAPAMAATCRERFADCAGHVNVICDDMWNTTLPKRSASLILSVLSLQFMPTAYRLNIIKTVYDSLADGGAFVFVEKIAGTDLDDEMVKLYYDMKRQNGYSEDKIMSKRRSLENVLSPLTPAWNEDMLRAAGFGKVEMFWRCLNFCGWVAVK